MRVALLSLVEATTVSTGAGPAHPRGSLAIGGRPVVQHQLALALAAGARRIVLQLEQPQGQTPPLADALRRMAEAAGAQFATIASPVELVPLVAPADDLLALADGVLFSAADLLRLVAAGQGILALPVETGLAAGFERIDINHADAGAMLLPGRVAARLGELPSDWNAYSALLRIGAQVGVPLRDVPERLVSDGAWLRVTSEDAAQRAERAWIVRLDEEDRAVTPGNLAARALVRGFGPALLHAGKGPGVIRLGAIALGLMALGAGWFDAAPVGFVLAGVAWLLERAAAAIERIERAGLLVAAGRFDVGSAMRVFTDVTFIILMALRSTHGVSPAPPPGAGFFAPLVAIGLLRLLPRVLRAERWIDWLEDRSLLAGLLLATSLVLPFGDALKLEVIALLVAALAATWRRNDDAPPRRRDDPPNPPLTTSP